MPQKDFMQGAAKKIHDLDRYLQRYKATLLQYTDTNQSASIAQINQIATDWVTVQFREMP